MGAPLVRGGGEVGSLKVEKDSTGVSGHSKQREQQTLQVRGNTQSSDKRSGQVFRVYRGSYSMTDHKLFF